MIIGAVDNGRYIERSKRLGKFCVRDYEILWELAGGYKEILLTPYIATEVSNLIDLDEYARVRAFEFAREIFANFKQANVSILEDSRDDLFLEFGLTDSSIINLSRDIDILTNDYRMLHSLYKVSPDRIMPYTPFKET
jgi:hypothetical protein